MAMHVQFTADQEQNTAQRIKHLEQSLMTTLLQVPSSKVILDDHSDCEGSTRNASVDRLGRAHEAAQGLDVDPILLARAAADWNEAQGLRWSLALSASNVVRRETRRVPSVAISVEDLEQEAVLGLFAAAKRFEPGRGVRFSVYARWWVRAQITRSIQLAGVTKISAATLELHRNANKLIQSDVREGVTRGVSELASELGVSTQRLRDVMEAGALRAVGEGDEPDAPSRIDALPACSVPSAEQAAIASDLAARLRVTIQGTFAARERRILASRYGIDADVAPVAEIAGALALSTERVRQLEMQCLAVLRDVFAREMDV